MARDGGPMARDARLLREFQISLIAGGAMVAYGLLDVALDASGVYPWTRMGLAAAELGIAAAVAAVAFGNARRVWLQRDDRDLGGLTFADVVLVAGFVAVGGVLLLALPR